MTLIQAIHFKRPRKNSLLTWDTETPHPGCTGRAASGLTSHPGSPRPRQSGFKPLFWEGDADAGRVGPSREMLL